MNVDTRDAHGRQQLPLPALGELVGGRFLVEGWVAQGGMAAVFRARDTWHDAPVALKVSSRLQVGGHARFDRETLMLAVLHHPAIVRYVAHGVSEQGSPFLAMEWLDGEDLACVLARQTLSPEQSVALLRRVCEGLALAHDRGVLHRDLKPSNLFVVGGDVRATKLLDFGVARYRGAGHTQTLTHAGSVVGTVGYMAPEQARGQPELSASADVFALGCVLFECLTGRAAFYGHHDLSVLSRLLHEEAPRVSELKPELGSFADALLARMLAKDPGRRPSDARELLRLLDQLDVAAARACPPSLTIPQHVTTSERRMVSLVLARPRRTEATLTTLTAQRRGDELLSLAQRFDAELLPTRAGGVLALALSGTGAATDQAQRAALLALALAGARNELAISVATGLLELGRALPVGPVVDRALLLLERTGEPSVIAIDALSYDLLEGRFEVERGPEGYLLRRERADSETPRRLLGKETPFVGRDKELLLLEATLREVVEDSVQRSVLISAPAGVGKSRLLHAFMEQLRRTGVARVLLARADPLGAASALLLVQRLIRAALDGAASAQPGLGRDRVWQTYLAALTPGAGPGLALAREFLSELLQLGQEPSARSPEFRAARNDPAVMAEQTRRAVEVWLSAELARGPLALVLEDLHWADVASLSYLESALARVSDRPLLLLASARPELGERCAGLLRLPGVQEVRLTGLTRKAAERLVRSVLPGAEHPVVSEIVMRADGNTFYLEELIRCVAEGGGTELPSSVLAMAQSRLARLELPARRVLRAASVFGGAAWSGGVARLLGAQLEADEWLALLSQREILIRRQTSRFAGQAEYEFRHALLRDAAYATLTDDDLRVAHRLAGAWLEEVGEHDALILADHHERGGERDAAVRWLTPAALAALEAGDYDGALALARRGLSLGAKGEARGVLLMLEGYVEAYRTQPSTSGLVEALGLFTQGSSHWWLTLSTLLFRALSLNERELGLRYLPLVIHSPPPAELSGAYGASLQAMAAGMVLVGRADVAWAALARFDELSDAQRSADPLFGAWLDLARCQLATTAPRQGAWELERALHWGRAAAAAMEQLGSAHGQATAYFYLGYASRVLGQYAEAEEALIRSVRHATRSGNLLLLQYSKLILTLVRLHGGDSLGALALLEGLGDAGEPSVRHGVEVMKAEVYFRRGDAQRALAGSLLGVSGPSSPYRRVAQATLARTQLALGDHAGALESVAQSLSEQVMAPPEYEIDLWASKAAAHHARGEAQLAAQAVRHALALVEAISTRIGDASLRAAFVGEIEANARALSLPRQLDIQI
ncbi:MAG TPA: protein kinase [Polyangiales bacterium]